MLLESSIMLLETFIAQVLPMTIVIYDCHIFTVQALGQMLWCPKKMFNHCCFDLSKRNDSFQVTKKSML
jgi:hypothetical protein